MEGAQAKSYVIGIVNPFGYGVTVFVTTDIARYSNQYKKWSEELASSLQFRTPKESAKTKEWIGGAKLLSMNSNYDNGPSYGGYSTYSSYSSRREILRRSNNRFSYYSSSQFSVNSGAGFAGFNSGDAAQSIWKVSLDAAGNSTLNLDF